MNWKPDYGSEIPDSCAYDMEVKSDDALQMTISRHKFTEILC